MQENQGSEYAEREQDSPERLEEAIYFGNTKFGCSEGKLVAQILGLAEMAYLKLT